MAPQGHVFEKESVLAGWSMSKLILGQHAAISIEVTIVRPRRRDQIDTHGRRTAKSRMLLSGCPRQKFNSSCSPMTLSVYRMPCFASNGIMGSGLVVCSRISV
jgi:hypothetical protein